MTQDKRHPSGSRSFRSRLAGFGAIGLLALGAVGGVIFWGGFNTVV
jgi:hypothetical protein